MTKIHEEYIRGTAAEVLEILSQKKEQLGEFSLYISGNSTK
jgi:16S rRNA (cytidine1402-2'-O)-methyltransferase